MNEVGAPTYLEYFTKYVNPPRAEETPFLTQQRLDDLENCQKQIITRDYYNQDCYSEHTETYQCHICNIKVPKMCYQKHNDSNQHETIKKIYEKVLERVSKQMYVSSVNTDNGIDQSLYYCEPCSTIIKIKNKNYHEATEYHADSIKRSISINNFYNIMTENIGFDVKEEKLPDEIIPFNSNNNYNDTQDMSIDACSSIDYQEIKDDLLDQKIILPPVQVENIIETKNVSTEEEKEQSFVDYGKEMIKKYNLKVTLPAVDGNFIKIVAPNGDRVKVSRDNFHSYQKSTTTYCQLCSEWIPQNTRTHDVTEKHVWNVFKPINDNFAREVENGWSHCVPCNKLVPPFSDDHSLGNDHKTIIKDTLIAKTDKTLCKDCNVYIDSHNFAVHVKSMKHLVMKHNSIKETGYNNIFCNICKITLPKSVLNMHIGTELHLTKKAKNVPGVKNKNTEVHLTKKTKYIPGVNGENKNTELSFTKKANNMPGVNVENKSTELNLTKKAMKRPVVNDENKNTEVSLTKKAKKMPEVNDVSKNTENHLTKQAKNVPSVNDENKNTELNLTKKAKKMPEVHNVSKNTQNHLTKHAKNVPSVNDENKNTKVHLTKKAKNMPDVNNKKKKNKANTIVNTKKIDAYNKKLEAYNKLMFYTDITKTQLICQICDVNVPDFDREIIKHMEGRYHIFAENQVLRFHSITRESSYFFCGCCGIRATDYIEHINSTSHTLEFAKKFQIDEIQMRKFVNEKTVKNFVAQLHRQLYTNLLKHNGVFKLNDSIFCCCLCQINLSRVSEINHVFGLGHIKAMDRLRADLRNLQ